MMTKETFCKIINALEKSGKTARKMTDGIIEAIKTADPNSEPSEMEWPLYDLLWPGSLTDDIIDALKEEFEDTEDEWITYYIYDLEYGTVEFSGNCIHTKDGTEVGLTSPEELYDFLIRNIREKRASEIFDGCNDKKDVKKPRTERVNLNGVDTEIECIDYDGPEDKIPLQMFTGMYFNQCGEIMKGRSSECDLSVRAGDKVIKMPNGKFYSIPKEFSI